MDRASRTASETTLDAETTGSGWPVPYAGAASEVGPAAGLDAPPIPLALATELYGHLADPVSGAKTEPTHADVGPAGAPTQAKTEPPSKEGLVAELDASLAREEQELDASKAKALADLDARIEAAKGKLDAAQVSDASVKDATRKIDATALGQDQDLLKQQSEAIAARIKQAEIDGHALMSQAGMEAAKLVSDAMVAGNKALIDAGTAAARFRSAAAAQAAAKRAEPADVVFGQVQLDLAAAQIEARGAAAAQNALTAAQTAFTSAIARANDEATHLRREAAGKAAMMKADAAMGAANAGLKGVGGVADARKAGDARVASDADAGRAKQKQQEDKTLADLQKQRAALVTQLDGQIAAKKKDLQARIAAAHQQVAAARSDPAALNKLAASVKSTTGQIEKVSEQMDASARAQVTMVGRRVDAETAQTVGVMKWQGQQSLAQIDADVRAANQAVVKAGKTGGDGQRQAGADFDKGEAKARDDIKASAARRAKQLEGRRQDDLENAELQTLDVGDREKREKEIAGRHELKGAQSVAELVTALAKFPPERRAGAIEEMPDDVKKLLADNKVVLDGLTSKVDAVEALKLVRDKDGKLSPADQGRIDGLMADPSLSIEQKNMILAAAGEGLTTALTPRETEDAIKGLLAAKTGGKIDPKRVQASLAGMTAEQMKQVTLAFKAKTDQELDSVIPTDLLPDSALGKDALEKKKKNGEGLGKILGAATGKIDSDIASIRDGLAEIDPALRDEAIAHLPPERQALGKQLLAAQKDADELKDAAAHDPGKLTSILERLPPAERINAIKASGLADTIDAKYQHLSDREADAMVKGLGVGKDGKVDPARVSAAFVGLDAGDRTELGDRFAADTGMKLEQVIPPRELPNDVLSPKAMAAKLEDQLLPRGASPAPSRTKVIHDWVAGLPEDRKAAAIAELGAADQKAAKLAEKGIEVADKLRSFDGSVEAGEAAFAAAAGVDKKASAKFNTGMEAAKKANLAAQMAKLTPAERNAVAQDGVDIGDHARLTDDEARTAKEALERAHGSSAQGKANVAEQTFDGMTAVQARQVADLYQIDHTSKLEDDFDVKSLPSGALSLSAQLADKRTDLAAPGASGDDPRAQRMLYDDVAAMTDEQRATTMAQLPPDLRRRVNLMLAMKEDVDDLKAIMAGGNPDPDVLKRVMAGRPQAERRALLDASGIADLMPDARGYGELSVAEKKAASLQLQCAHGLPDDKGNVIVDKASVDHVFKNVDKDQLGQIKWQVYDDTGVQLGEMFSGHQGVLPAELQVKEVNLKDPKELKKYDDTAKALFTAMDHGCDQDAIINNLRGKSRSEIKAIALEYAKHHEGHDLYNDLMSKLELAGALEGAPEALAAVKALLGDDPVAAAVESLKYAKRGHGADGTNEQLMKDTLEAITDPEERKRVIAKYNAWADEHGELQVHDMLKDELGGTDLDEASALLEGNPAKIRAARAYAAMDGSNNYKKLKEQIEACPDARSRRELAEEFREVARAHHDKITDLDAYMKDQFGDDNEYKALGKLQQGDVAGAYAAEIEIGDRNDMCEAYAKAPPGWHGSDAAWRERLTATHDEEAKRNGRHTMDELASGSEATAAEVLFDGKWDGDSLNAMDRRRLGEMMKNGHMEPVTAIEFGASKHGNDADVVNAIKYGPDGKVRTKAQIKELSAEWNRTHDTPLDEFVVDELGGDDEFDALDALKGEPEDDDERVARMRLRNEHEHSGLFKWVTNIFTESDEMADANLVKAEAALADVHADEHDEEAHARLAEAESGLDLTIGEHREAQQSIANVLSQVMKYGAMGSLAFTGLLSGPLVQLLQGSFMFSSLNKKMLLGDAMSGKQLARGLAVEVPEMIINAVVTAVTAGAGTGEVIAGEQALEQSFMQTVGKLLTEGVKAFGKNMAMGALTSLPSEIEGLISGEKNLGGLVGDLALGSLLGTMTHGMGAGLGAAGMKGLSKQMLTALGDVGLQTFVAPALRGEKIDPTAIFTALQAMSAHATGLGQKEGHGGKKPAPNEGPLEKLAHVVKGGAEDMERRTEPTPRTVEPHETAPRSPAEHETAPRSPAEHETAPPAPAEHETAPPTKHEPEPEPARHDPELARKTEERIAGERDRIDKIADPEERAAAERLVGAADKLADPAMKNKALDLAASEAGFPERMARLEEALAHAETPEGQARLRETMDQLGKAKEIGLEKDFHRANAKELASAKAKLGELNAARDKLARLEKEGGAPEAIEAAKANVKRAREWIEMNDGETQAVLDDVVAQTRQAQVAAFGDAFQHEGDALNPDAQGGSCGPSQTRAVAALKAMGGEVSTLSTQQDGGSPVFKNNGKGGNHFATVVKMPNGKVYLVDPMFGQFLQDDAGAGGVGRNMIEHGGERIARGLANDGFIELTPETAEIYGKAMSGREGPPEGGKFTVDDFVKRGEGEAPTGSFPSAGKGRVARAEAYMETLPERRAEQPAGPQPIGYTPSGEAVYPGEKPSGRWQDARGDWHGADGKLLESHPDAVVRNTRSRLVRSKEGRSVLDYLDGEGKDKPITMDPGKGTSVTKDGINLNPHDGSEALAEKLVHEGYQAQTFAKDVRIEAGTSEGGFIDKALRNEAEAVAAQGEHAAATGLPGSKVAQQYLADKARALEELRKENPGVPISELRNRAREAATRKMADEIGGMTPETSLDDQGHYIEGKPKTYADHYGEYFEKVREHQPGQPEPELVIPAVGAPKNKVALAEQADKRPKNVDQARAAELEAKGYTWRELPGGKKTLCAPEGMPHVPMGDFVDQAEKPIDFHAEPIGAPERIPASKIPREASSGNEVSVQEGMEGQARRREAARKGKYHGDEGVSVERPASETPARVRYDEEFRKNPKSEATKVAEENLRREQYHINNASRRIGEGAAIIAMREKARQLGKPLETVYGGWEHASTSGDLDMVFKIGDKYYVVEAKGGTSELGSAEIMEGPNKGKRAQQGSKEYLSHIVSEMEKSAQRKIEELEAKGARGSLTPQDRVNLEALEARKARGQLTPGDRSKLAELRGKLTPEDEGRLEEARKTLKVAGEIKQAAAKNSKDALEYDSVRANFKEDGKGNQKLEDIEMTRYDIHGEGAAAVTT